MERRNAYLSVLSEFYRYNFLFARRKRIRTTRGIISGMWTLVFFAYARIYRAIHFLDKGSKDGNESTRQNSIGPSAWLFLFFFLLSVWQDAVILLLIFRRSDNNNTRRSLCQVFQCLAMIYGSSGCRGLFTGIEAPLSQDLFSGMFLQSHPCDESRIVDAI